MTDRVQSLTVFFEKEVREDDVQVYVDAIRLMRGVSNVELGPVLDSSDYAAREMVGLALWEKMRELLLEHRGK